MDMLRKRINAKYLTKPEDIKRALADVIAEIVDKGDRNKLSSDYPLVILMIGINGGGKTTSIGKLANMFKERGHSVLLAAADTFRAAAADQLVEVGKPCGSSSY